MVSKEVLIPKIGITIRYRKVSIPDLGIEIRYRKVLIDFDLKIIICRSEGACTNFKYFERIEKYQSELSILRY